MFVISSVVSLSMTHNLFISPPKQGLSIEKCMHKPMYMCGLFSKIRRIRLLCPIHIFSISKIYLFPVFSKIFFLLAVFAYEGKCRRKVSGKEYCAAEQTKCLGDFLRKNSFGNGNYGLKNRDYYMFFYFLAKTQRRQVFSLRIQGFTRDFQGILELFFAAVSSSGVPV
jgi:hypothetical protein